MKDDILYTEEISSKRTEALFLALVVVFLLLLIWRVTVNGLDTLASLFLVFLCIFLFYSVNYRTLVICLTSKLLQLTFGCFTWKVPLENIAECQLDEIPLFKKMGGAGIHFMFIRKRYRASFNFLEYTRLVIALKKKAGPLQDISFSTRQPDELLQLIQDAVSSQVNT